MPVSDSRHLWLRRKGSFATRRSFAIDGNSCWIWQGHITKWGYGTLGRDGHKVMACRVFYEWFWGPIADGLLPDHLCRNRACVNPAHLEAVSKAENARRAEPMQPEGTRTRWKLTRAQKDALCAEVAAGASKNGTARKYGVTKRAVQLLIKRRKQWAEEAL